MEEIINVTDQIEVYANEIIVKCQKTMKHFDISFAEALKVYDIAEKAINNDVLWKRMRNISFALDNLNDTMSELSELLENTGSDEQ